ncbi:hypothetical protein MRX96_013674 [Rhipicephalus microplus]
MEIHPSVAGTPRAPAELRLQAVQGGGPPARPGQVGRAGTGTRSPPAPPPNAPAARGGLGTSASCTPSRDPILDTRVHGRHDGREVLGWPVEALPMMGNENI